MNAFTLLALMLQLQVTLPVAAQQATKATIEGTVIRTGSAEPIQGVRVILTRVPQLPASGTPTFTSTDSQGKYVLKDLDAGTYRVTFAANGYAKQDYGQRSFTGQGIPISVAAGQTKNDIDIAMSPAGNVSGHIRNFAGVPVAGVPVQLSRVTYSVNGQKGFQTVVSENTNDRGEYRFYWVTPGSYYLTAGTAPNPRNPPFGATVTPNLVPGESFTFTYYPGVTDVDKAVAVDVGAGAELGGFDFSVLEQKLLKVSGRIVDSRTGTSPAAVVISVVFQTFGGGSSNGGGNNYNASLGTFSMDNLVPGTYVIQAYVQNAIPANTAFDPALRAATNEARYAVATQLPIELTNSDLENVILKLGRSPLVGRITVTGTPPPSLSVMRVYLRPSLNGTITNSFGVALPTIPETNEDGTFRIDSVLPGEYRLAMPGLPDDFYIKDARFNQNDVLYKPWMYSAAENGNLEIIVGRGAVQISGTAVDGQLRPASGIPVVLVPDQHRDRMDLYRNATTDANGRYALRGIAPGDYKLFAWESVDSFAWFDPDFMKSQESLGKAIHVVESLNQIVDLKTLSGQ